MTNRISTPKIAVLLVLALLYAPYCLAEEGVKKRMKVLFDNPTYDFELQRTLGVTLSGGADINECLSTGKKIVEGDEESWYTHWQALADRVYLIGERALAAGHTISAREAFQRACNYYRTAEFFLHGNPKDPRINESWRLSRDSFQKAAQLMEHPVEVITIPYEETTLPGYFLRPDESGKRRKTLIIQTGFDGTAEELYFTRAFFALKRGYNVLLFEGPGQGGALREQHLFFRTDWEKVVTPVVDYALSRKEVDPDRLALMGISMGGYLVSRAAAFEHRLAAIIANPSSGDLYVQDRAQLPELRDHPEESNQYLRQAMEKNIGFRWFINNGMFSTNTASPVEFLLFWSQYELGELVTKIKTNTLCVASKGDHFMNYKRIQQFYDDLQCSKTLLLFTREEAASDHCQMGALAVSSSRIYDWLDEVLLQ